MLFLQRKYGLTYTRATASVLMDKLLEFLVDFILLAVGLTAIFRAGALTESRNLFSWELLGLVALMLWPPIHITLLYHRKYPLTALVRAIPFIPEECKVDPLFTRSRMAGRKFLPPPSSKLAGSTGGFAPGRGRDGL